jgi:glycine betaine/proline transport system ATP-binding protein
VTTALEFKEVDILFARESGRVSRARMDQALRHLDSGQSRADILTSTGVVVGVAGANLTVRTGDISVLMGLSGSGKSTLLRAANGLNPVTRGEVWVAHRGQRVNVAHCDTTTLRQLRRGGVAMMFQQFGLLPWRSVRENVGLGLELRGESAAQRRQRVDEKLELVGLSQWADHDVGELSGGMQQRVGLARAFATDADILLMDEPFSALDPLIRTKLQDELVALQRTLRKTILFVTHDLDEALRIGDRISVLEGGRIVQTGAPDDIVLRPQSAYVAEFVRHMNPLTVLRGDMVMTPITAGVAGPYPLGDRYQATWTEQGQLAVSMPSGPVELCRVPLHTPLRTLIGLQQSTGHPVLLMDGDRVAGICTPNDVVRALAGTHGAVKQAGDAN